VRGYPYDRRRVALILAAGLVAPTAARAAYLDLDTDASRLGTHIPGVYTPPTNLRTVADLYKRMTCQVQVAGQGPFPFVVDTGANQSVISSELAAQLGLALGPVEPLNGVAGVQMTATASAALQVGARPAEPVTFSVLPAAAIGGAGMLGLDRLEDQMLTLDFRGERLVIEPSRHASRDPSDVAMKAERRDGQLTLVDADVAGIPVIAFLDSGAQDTIGNPRLRELALARTNKSDWTTVSVLSATGQTISAEMADLPALRVGGLRLPIWPVAFADLHTFELWGLTRRPAILLGVDILSRFDYVAMDFARSEVRFRLPEAS
jgi:predicted aspartyl protease